MSVTGFVHRFLVALDDKLHTLASRPRSRSRQGHGIGHLLAIDAADQVARSMPAAAAGEPAWMAADRAHFHYQSQPAHGIGSNADDSCLACRFADCVPFFTGSLRSTVTRKGLSAWAER